MTSVVFNHLVVVLFYGLGARLLFAAGVAATALSTHHVVVVFDIEGHAHAIVIV